MAVSSSRVHTPLIRAVGRWGLTAFAINLTVGAGILGLQGRIQSLVGNYSIAAIALCGVWVAIIALCFAEVSSRFEQSGGPQLYASVAIGPLAGFCVGWLLWISRVGSCAAVVNLLVDYAGAPWPSVDSSSARVAIILTVTLAYAAINIAGMREATVVSAAFTLLKLLPLVAFVAVGIFFVEPQSLHLDPLPPARDFTAATLLAAYAFFGFDATTVLAGEVRDPSRSVPFSIAVCLACVLALYTLIQVVCVGTLPDLASSQRPLADAAAMFAGAPGVWAISITAVVSCAGVYGASFTPGTRLLFALSSRGQLPSALSMLHRRLCTPLNAIVVTTAVVLGLALSGSFIYLVKITLISRIMVYATTCALLPFFRRCRNVREPTFKVPAGDFIACLAVGTCLLLLAGSSMRELLDVAVAVAIGLVLFYSTQQLNRRFATTAQ